MLSQYTSAGVSDSFWSQVDRNGPVPEHRPELGPCWLWTHKLNQHGYGWFRSWLAHRVAFWLDTGIDPGDLKVLHRCDNPPCVRPLHLFLGTQADNIRDMVEKGRGQHGERHYRAALTEADVVKIRELADTLTHREVAAQYGISRRAVGKIITGTAWRLAPGEVRAPAPKRANLTIEDVARIKVMALSMSQRSIARMLGIDQASISRAISGHRQVRPGS